MDTPTDKDTSTNKKTKPNQLYKNIIHLHCSEILSNRKIYYIISYFEIPKSQIKKVMTFLFLVLKYVIKYLGLGQKTAPSYKT